VEQFFYQCEKNGCFLEQYVYHIGSYHYNWHRELELMTVLRGELEVCIDGASHLLRDSDVILIGSNKGLRARDFIEVIIKNANVPVIIDAGIGRPSQAAEAMEMGADAVMAYTAVASAGNIPLMAEAFKHAIDAGRAAYLSGLGKVTEGQAVPSSPTTGYLH